MIPAIADTYADTYARNGVDAAYLAGDGSAASVVRVRFVDAGEEEPGHGSQRKGVVKVLRTDFPSAPPKGATFEIDGAAWTVLGSLGRADGTNDYQLALWCARGRTLSTR